MTLKLSICKVRTNNLTFKQTYMEKAVANFLWLAAAGLGNLFSFNWQKKTSPSTMKFNQFIMPYWKSFKITAKKKTWFEAQRGNKVTYNDNDNSRNVATNTLSKKRLFPAVFVCELSFGPNDFRADRRGMWTLVNLMSTWTCFQQFFFRTFKIEEDFTDFTYPAALHFLIQYFKQSRDLRVPVSFDFTHHASFLTYVVFDTN